EIPTLDYVLLLATRLSAEDRLRLIAHLALQLAETPRATMAIADDQSLERRILQIREILRTMEATTGKHPLLELDDLIAESKTPGSAKQDSAVIISEIRR
ncbi:MAG: hypothetical protein RMJ54_18460, partial [Roseiflexaceae bacterium]|nr:hypothetical protein [Roseiflexaceae bacterium]